MTSRHIAAAILCILCLLPAEAHLSSYGITQTRNFNGYQLSVTFHRAAYNAGLTRRRHGGTADDSGGGVCAGGDG